MLAPWALWCWSRWLRSWDREPVSPLVDKQGDCIPSCGQTRSPPAVWIFITLNMIRDQSIVALTKKLCRQLLLILGFMAFTAQVSWLQLSQRKRKNFCCIIYSVYSPILCSRFSLQLPCNLRKLTRWWYCSLMKFYKFVGWQNISDEYFEERLGHYLCLPLPNLHIQSISNILNTNQKKNYPFNQELPNAWSISGAILVALAIFLNGAKKFYVNNPNAAHPSWCGAHRIYVP